MQSFMTFDWPFRIMCKVIFYILRFFHRAAFAEENLVRADYQSLLLLCKMQEMDMTPLC